MDIEAMVKEVLNPMGLDILEATLKSKGTRSTLLVRIERSDETPISLLDLSQANRTLGDYFDLHDPIPGEYNLQVESPGAERPLITARHFERFVGLKSKFRADNKTFFAKVGKVEGQNLHVVLENGDPETLELGNFKAWLAEWPDTPR